MDKEMRNIMELQSYMETNSTLEHRSGVVDVFKADVDYQDSSLGNMHLQNAEIRFEHSYNNELKIDALTPPYYGSFWLTRQDFEFKDGKLYISGIRSDSGKKYQVIIG